MTLHFTCFYFLLTLFQLSKLIATECPNIVSRLEWGARNPAGPMDTLNIPVNFTVIYHSAESHCKAKSDCIRIVKGIQNFHIDTRGWSDIGYSFLVGEDGNVYEGRGWLTMGAHAIGYNKDSLGICILGSYTSSLPNALALSAAKKLIECSIEKGYLKKDYIVRGHRDGTLTECPGDALYNEIKTWPRYI